ncbi:outer membrane lipoprotein-sorting protein [Terriglobus albidus]|uniref:Outer membrane lipoprotein-sorting protein n=1 Tax=Terriglobus albidus TaxID=1592106 RepID=A0A5B9E9M5_9BACT|nr:outer membrane lipoprotein-sorting protein [Terriglobus albidus]QEE27320.1 outer membrane lipoprotein-sorting protein [Terriglobus albidus]
MKRLLPALVLLCASAVFAQNSGFGPLDTTAPAGLTPDDIVKKMGARESEFAKVREDYGFRRTVKIQTLNDVNKIDGEYQMVADITFSKEGRQVENVVFAPQNTLERIIMSPSDVQDIERKLPFVLTAEDLPQYNIKYIGKQKIDELDTYVLSAEPKTLEKNQRYFQGKVYVDQQDFQIVLVNGKTVPDDLRRGHEDLHIPYTTYYEQIDGKYWFPTYTKGEGILHFAAQDGSIGEDVHVRSYVRYTNYKRFRSTIRLIYEGQDVTEGADKRKQEEQQKTPPQTAPPASNPPKQ